MKKPFNPQNAQMPKLFPPTRMPKGKVVGTPLHCISACRQDRNEIEKPYLYYRPRYRSFRVPNASQ